MTTIDNKLTQTKKTYTFEEVVEYEKYKKQQLSEIGNSYSWINNKTKEKITFII